MSSDKPSGGHEPGGATSLFDPIGTGQGKVASADTSDPKGEPDSINDGGGDGPKPSRNFLFRLSLNEWLTLLVGVGSLVVSYFTYRTAADTGDLKDAVAALQKQATASQGQLIEMQAEQRPWIRATVQFMGIKFDASDGAHIFWHVSYKNVGHTPAQNVQIRLVPVVVTEKTALRSIEQEIEQCKLGARDTTTLSAPGVVIFPDETAPNIIGGSGDGNGYIDAAQYRGAWGMPHGVEFKIVGCLDYSFGAPAHYEHGQTGFEYEISERGPGGNSHFIKMAPNRILEPNDVIFDADPFSSGYFR